MSREELAARRERIAMHLYAALAMSEHFEDRRQDRSSPDSPTHMAAVAVELADELAYALDWFHLPGFDS